MESQGTIGKRFPGAVIRTARYHMKCNGSRTLSGCGGKIKPGDFYLDLGFVGKGRFWPKLCSRCADLPVRNEDLFK
jgi:hypothetical protein